LNPAVEASSVTAEAPRLASRPFVAITGASMFAFVSLGMLLPVLPRYAKGPLDAGGIGIGLAVGAASLSAFLFQPPAGRLGDRIGRRPLLLGGTLLMAAASLSYVAVSSLEPLIALRFVAGTGEALLFVGAATAINDLAPPERRGQALSFFTLALYGGLAIGPLVGDLVLGGDRFDAVWLVSAGCALAAGLLILAAVPETRDDHEAERTGGLVYRGAIGPGLVLLSALFAFGGFNAFIALYVLDLGFERTGLVFATFACVVIGVRSFGSRLPDTLGARRAALVALVGVGTGMLIIAAWPSVAGVFVGTVVFSFGQALAFPSIMSFTVAGAPPAERGAAVGTISSFVDLAILSGAVVAGALVGPLGYRGAFAVSAVVALGGLLLLSRLRR
jgi:MFS family permease